MKVKKQDVILLISLCAVLLFGGIATVFFPAPQFSEQENRYLSDMPVFTRRAVLGGEYTKAIDVYLTEHLPTRGTMRKIRAASELTLGKRIVGSVLVCPNGRLIQLSGENERIRQQNTRTLAKIEALALEKKLPCNLCILPEQASLQDLLPHDYPAKKSGVSKDLLTLLNHQNYWYRTDHHMTTQGAFALYAHLGKALNYTPYGIENFRPTVVSDRFFGTSDAKAGIPLTEPDAIMLYRYESDTDYTVKKGGTALPLTGFYDMGRLQTRDGYGVFFGGNHETLEIARCGEDTRPVLLVIKDSYANALLPFLALHYRLLVADPRYGCHNMTALLARADRILVLCGEGTLSTGFLETAKI